MPQVDLEDAEWSQVISIIAASHPLIARISHQLMAQKQAKGNGHAAPGISVGSDQGNEASGAPAATSSGGGAQQRPARPARR